MIEPGSYIDLDGLVVRDFEGNQLVPVGYV